MDSGIWPRRSGAPGVTSSEPVEIDRDPGKAGDHDLGDTGRGRGRGLERPDHDPRAEQLITDDGVVAAPADVDPRRAGRPHDRDHAERVVESAECVFERHHGGGGRSAWASRS